MGIVGMQYDYVYYDLVTKIYAGKLRNGQSLPTLAELCRSYDVGRNTVRSAIQLLCANGYVACAPRRQPVVCFDMENPKYYEKYARDLASRRDKVRDIYEFFADVMPEVVEMVLGGAGSEEKEKLTEMLERIRAALGAVTEQELGDTLNELYNYTISLSDNRLLIQMYGEMFQSLQSPMRRQDRKSITFRMFVPAVRETLRIFEDQLKEGDYPGLKRQISFFCRLAGVTSEKYYNRLCKTYPDVEQKPFYWGFQSLGNMSYMASVAKIIQSIRSGRYQPGDYLPSYACIARKQQVSVKTVRTAIAILNKTQVVSSINGKGTRVNPVESYRTDILFEDERQRENMVLFLEAFQILVMISRPMVIRGGKALTGEELKQLEERAETEGFNLDNFMRVIFEKNRSPIVVCVFRRLIATLTWGVMVQERWRDYSHEKEYMGLCIDYLKKGEYQELADWVHSFYGDVWRCAKADMEREGIYTKLII